MKSRFALFAIMIGLLTGCEATTVTTPASTHPTESEKKKADVHIRTPNVNVDVEHRGNNQGVDVDVKRKDR